MGVKTIVCASFLVLACAGRREPFASQAAAQEQPERILISGRFVEMDSGPARAVSTLPETPGLLEEPE